MTPDASRSFKPEGYNSASPYLVSADAAATIRFAQQALGGELLRSFQDEQGRMLHAEVRIDDTVVMVSDAAPSWPPVAAHVHVYVPEVDATYDAAIAAGATSVQPPLQKQDEDKRGGVRDAGGITWWIATRLG